MNFSCYIEHWLTYIITCLYHLISRVTSNRQLKKTIIFCATCCDITNNQYAQIAQIKILNTYFIKILLIYQCWVIILCLCLILCWVKRIGISRLCNKHRNITYWPNMSGLSLINTYNTYCNLKHIYCKHSIQQNQKCFIYIIKTNFNFFFQIFNR